MEGLRAGIFSVSLVHFGLSHWVTDLMSILVFLDHGGDMVFGSSAVGLIAISSCLLQLVGRTSTKSSTHSKGAKVPILCIFIRSISRCL